MLCRHEDWGSQGELPPTPPPTEMVIPCEHLRYCPTCNHRVSVSPCPHGNVPDLVPVFMASVTETAMLDTDKVETRTQ